MKVKFSKPTLPRGKKKLVIGITAGVLAVAAVAGLVLTAPASGETVGVYSFPPTKFRPCSSPTPRSLRKFW